MVQLALTDRYDLGAMAAFMRTDDIYWSATDALAPQPEQMDFEGYLLHPDVWSLAATYDGHVIGYVLFNKRTSVGAEIHCGFHKAVRGAVTKTFVQLAIARAFEERGLLKLWAIIPSDNRPACMLAGACGFEREGLLRNAIVRSGAAEGKPPLRNLVIMGLSRPDVRN
jgi:RimJ/RimL family protein N-acetyltransferase